MYVHMCKIFSKIQLKYYIQLREIKINVFIANKRIIMHTYIYTYKCLIYIYEHSMYTKNSAAFDSFKHHFVLVKRK